MKDMIGVVVVLCFSMTIFFYGTSALEEALETDSETIYASKLMECENFEVFHRDNSITVTFQIDEELR